LSAPEQAPRDGDISRLLIEKKQAGNYGLAPKRWLAQLKALRELPEVTEEEAA
jgi:hypothetical protein